MRTGVHTHQILIETVSTLASHIDFCEPDHRSNILLFSPVLRPGVCRFYVYEYGGENILFDINDRKTLNLESP